MGASPSSSADDRGSSTSLAAGNAGASPSAGDGRETHAWTGVTWTEWRRFPDPRRGELLLAPIGPGAFEIRSISTKDPITYGAGERLAERLTCLLPLALGRDIRQSRSRRQYILVHVRDLEYRTAACPSRADAEAVVAAFDRRRYLWRF